MDEQARHQLRQAKLSPREMLCLALSCYDGLTTRAIANRLEMPQSSVVDLIMAGRWKLEQAGLALRPMTTDPGPMRSLGRDLSTDEIKARW